jgi:hypothetical protein
MAPAAAFAQVLDDCLDHPPIGEAAAARRSTSTVATRSLYWFEGVASSAPLRAADVNVKAARARSMFRLVQPAAPRPARALSPAQRDALNEMIGLGAQLDANFTLRELRSQFRALARMFHPDRHQGTGRTSAEKLSSRFVTLRRAYDVLKKAA